MTAQTLAQRNGRTLAAMLEGNQHYGDLYRTANVSGYSDRQFLADVHIARIRPSEHPSYELRVIDPRDGQHVGWLSRTWDRQAQGQRWSAHSDNADGIAWLGYFDSPSKAASAITGL